MLAHLPSGTIDMNLHEMPRPSVSAAACTLELLPEFNPQAEIINLFEQITIKGFWPVWSNRKEGKELTVSGGRELTVSGGREGGSLL